MKIHENISVIKERFLSEYRKWAYKDTSREVNSGFCFLDLVTSQVFVDTVSILRSVAPDQQIALFNIFLKKACSSAESISDIKLSKPEVALDEYYRRQMMGRAIAHLNTNCDNRRLNKRMLRDLLTNKLSIHLGFVKNETTSVYSYSKAFGNVNIITQVEIEKKFLRYEHAIELMIPNRANSNSIIIEYPISIGRWMGMSAETIWEYALCESEEHLINAIGVLARHFIDSFEENFSAFLRDANDFTATTDELDVC